MRLIVDVQKLQELAPPGHIVNFKFVQEEEEEEEEEE